MPSPNNYRIIADLHTHTVASEHAFSTLKENIIEAKSKGLEILGISDHGPKTKGGPTSHFFSNMLHLPEEMEGIRLLKGVEANILEKDGATDLTETYLKKLDYAIVSMHAGMAPAQSATENTDTYIRVMEKSWATIIGHPDNPSFPIEAERFVIAAKKTNTAIEVNNHSFSARSKGISQFKAILQYAIQYQAPVIVNSDAHWHTAIGSMPKALELLEEINFPENLILNTNSDRLYAFIAKKRQ